MTRRTYDCQACGACCRSPRYNRERGIVDYVQVFPTDVLFRLRGLRAMWTVRNGDGEWHMRLAEDGRCAVLRGEIGVHATCGIYEVRPQVCRNLEPGSDKCVAARIERGLDPKP
ncbi:MAG: YkgJ family cysteine cluster protein [Myxococcota bacterium]